MSFSLRSGPTPPNQTSAERKAARSPFPRQRLSRGVAGSCSLCGCSDARTKARRGRWKLHFPGALGSGGTGPVRGRGSDRRGNCGGSFVNAGLILSSIRVDRTKEASLIGNSWPTGAEELLSAARVLKRAWVYRRAGLGPWHCIAGARRESGAGKRWQFRGFFDLRLLLHAQELRPLWHGLWSGFTPSGPSRSALSGRLFESFV
ncbi:Hypothetical predicted protein [Marmota monax]|uniref:Uncharacterized protein n=1 Tax=Marmota monax TaxID=9995 RepID=A0A5E4DA35_MARMO|nr:hypothetical protein GHT09_014953 [Marmota monax]VTJ89609.1 Hypothetical predicted protein [Marmota monax]